MPKVFKCKLNSLGVMILSQFLLIIIACIVIHLAFYSQKIDEEEIFIEYPAYSGNITIDQAIEILEKSRYSHEYYLTNIEEDPSLITGRREREWLLKFHQNCVNNYNAVISLIEKNEAE